MEAYSINLYPVFEIASALQQQVDREISTQRCHNMSQGSISKVYPLTGSDRLN